MRIKMLAAMLILAAMHGCAATAPPPRGEKTAPASVRPSAVIGIWEYSGANRSELKSFLDAYAGQPEKLSAARFLVANLPPADRVSLSAEMLKENLDYAFLARESFPWARRLPWDIFLHYVLPHRLSQEPAQSVRAQLFRELAPEVAGGDARFALEAVNAWLVGQMGFRTTSRWDLGPKGLMRRGFGRCEEAVILFAAAARAVGLPVREAVAPAWQHVDDNHAWAEVWLDGVWTPVDPGRHGLSHTGNAARAPFVVALVYGSVNRTDEAVYRRLPGATLLNVTPAYAPVFEARVQVADHSGRPAPNATVFAGVYNYGSFRPVARIRTDSQGHGRALLGAGTFLLSCRRGSDTAFDFISWLPNSTETKTSSWLTLSNATRSNGTFVLSVPGSERAENVKPLGRSQELRLEENRLEQDRKERFEGFQRLNKAYAQRVGFNATMVDALDSARGNAPEMLRALQSDQRVDAGAYYLDMDEKDRVAASSRDVLESLAFSRAGRDYAAGLGLVYDNATYQAFVARDRLLYEPFSLWRSVLAKPAREMFASGLQQGVNRTAWRIASLSQGPPFLFGPSLRPQGLLALGSVFKKSDRCVLGAALLRAAGIPADCQNEWGFINYYDGNAWRPMFWDAPDQLGRSNATAGSRAFFGAPAGVMVRFFRGGENVSERMRYFRDFSLSRFNSVGYFESLEKTVDVQFLPDKQAVLLRVPEGRYWLMAGTRKDGSVRVGVYPVEAKNGRTTGPVDVYLAE